MISPQERKIEEIITPLVEERHLRLVCARLVNESHGMVLRVMAEDPETKNLGIDDCAALSQEISALLDVEDPIDGRYLLEVSSPGVDRPLISAQDFVEYQDYEVKIEIDPPLDGQKRFRGRLRGMTDGDIILDTDQGELAVPFSGVTKAKLVMNDELIQKVMKKHEKKKF